MSEMVEVNTREVEGAALDWLVAKAVKQNIDIFPSPFNSSYWPVYAGTTRCYQPSASWQQGGSLVEQYNLTLSSPKSSVHRNGGPSHGWGESGVWSACTWEKGVNGKRATGYHESSALTAAMRTIVKFELGDTVEVPKELVT